jgi:hypothetical protein
MWFLWIVGRDMETLYGSREFLGFYLASAVISTLGWAALSEFSPHSGVMLGASGAVMAVAVLYAMYFPRRELLLFFVLPVPMWLIVSLYLFFPLIDRNGAANVAIEAHLVGAACGVVYKYFDLRLTRLLSSNPLRFRFRFGRPKLRIFSPPTPPYDAPSRGRAQGPTWSSGVGLTGAKPSSSAAVLPEELLDARVDEILAKIAREGREALSEEENRVLQEASRRAKIRRSDRL